MKRKWHRNGKIEKLDEYTGILVFHVFNLPGSSRLSISRMLPKIVPKCRKLLVFWINNIIHQPKFMLASPVKLPW